MLAEPELIDRNIRRFKFSEPLYLIVIIVPMSSCCGAHCFHVKFLVTIGRRGRGSGVNSSYV